MSLDVVSLDNVHLWYAQAKTVDKGGTEWAEYSQWLSQTSAPKYVLVACSFGHIDIPILVVIKIILWAWFIDACWLGKVIVLILSGHHQFIRNSTMSVGSCFLGSSGRPP